MPTLLHLAHTPQSRHATLNGLRLHYLDWGDAGKPPFFMLHGFASCAHTYDQAADALCGRYHVVAPDHRGHGDSAWAADGYDLHKAVADFAALAEHVQAQPFSRRAQRFTLMGHSMGGMLAIEYAARHAQAVEKLIIVDIGPETIRQGAARIQQDVRAWPDAFASVDEVYRLMRAQDTLGPDEVMYHRAFHLVKQRPDGSWAWKADPLLRSPARPVARNAPPEVRWEMLAAIRCPTLVVRGERSDVLSQEVAEHMAKTLPNGRLALVPNAGHRVPLHNFPGFIAAVRGFLDA